MESRNAPSWDLSFLELCDGGASGSALAALAGPGRDHFQCADTIAGVETVLRYLGQGSFAEVHLAMIAGFEDPVAMKVFKAGPIEPGSGAEREVIVASTVPPHEHLVRFLGVLGDPGQALIFEYCEGGSLHDLIHGASQDWFSKLSLGQRLTPIVHVANALGFLHSHGVIHRDVKPRNVLLTEAVTYDNSGIPPAKLGDFGLSRFLVEGESGERSRTTGSALYMAPEVMLSGKYDGSADIYSLGITAHHVCSGSSPYNVSCMKPRLLMQIMDGRRPDLNDVVGPDDCAQVVKDVLTCSWDQDPGERLTAIEMAERIAVHAV